MTTALSLAVLLVPFALIVFAVLLLIRTTEIAESDELMQQLDDTLPADVREQLLQQWLDGLCNAPTEPTLEVWAP